MTYKETYDYCEQFIQEELKCKIRSSGDTERNISHSTTTPDKDEEELIVLMNQIGNLYKHLENIQQMKKTYLLGR